MYSMFLHAALHLGSKGYVREDSAIDDIVTAINELVNGRSFTSLADYDLFFTRRQNLQLRCRTQQSPV